jgi:hypothetical protein
MVTSEFDHVSVEEFAVVQLVAREGLWPFLVNSVYGLDGISQAEAEPILAALSLPDPLPWTVPMVQVQGSA